MHCKSGEVVVLKKIVLDLIRLDTADKTKIIDAAHWASLRNDIRVRKP